MQAEVNTRVDGPALVKLVTSVFDAVNAGDGERSMDGMRQLARCSVTTSLLLSTGAGKKVVYILPFRGNFCFVTLCTQ